MFTTRSSASNESARNFSSNSSRPPIATTSAPGHNHRGPSLAFRISKEGDRGGSLGTMPSPSLKYDPCPESATRQYNQLPTPQSPSNFGHYIANALYTPNSPVPDGSQSSHSHLGSTVYGQRLSAQRPAGEEGWTNSASQQTATPESSPFARTTPRSANVTATRSGVRAEGSALRGEHTFAAEPSISSSTLAPAHRISASPSDRPSQLSSPFMAKLSVAEQITKSKPAFHSQPHSYSPEPRPTQADDTFSPTVINDRHSNPPPASLPHSFFSPPMSPQRPAAGGEMERIRQAAMQDRLAHFREAESRRPEYLKRTKRTFSEADSGALAEDESAQDPVVGITESPVKGRRLKLFQETSEESFEESLMAGGYGRYRTADWVRQPQPILLTTLGSAGPSNIVSALERAEPAPPPAPPTEKETRKRQRLAAFQERTNSDGSAKLQPVELAGRGRVLLDIPAEGEDTSMAESPGKKKAPARRKKKGELIAGEKKALALAAAASGDPPQRPNWPDAEFPWRLRTEERAEELKAQEVEKMKAIERFLDRDSDDEEEEVIRREERLHESARMGRGKMVPLRDNLDGSRPQAGRKSMFFPTDPADARAALMSKKSVRTLSYRQQKRQRLEIDDESDDEALCICNGRDDGRELVQCDGCETWYHLRCIGIKDIAQLGKEEDPWFCHECDRPRRLPSTEPELPSEPTFVPTDDRPRLSPSSDAPFFQPSSLQDSPMAWDAPRMPRTPDRNQGCEYEPGLSSGSSWVNSSRGRSSPPHYPAQDVRVYTNYENFHPYDESPFDPSSTPSRGIKFGASFTTPKNNVWSSRAFHTPSKGGGVSSSGSKDFGPTGIQSSALDDGRGENNGGSGYDSSFSDEESPIRRVMSADNSKARRIMGSMDSPLASRSTITTSYHLLDESPIMRYSDLERRRD